MRNRLTHPKRSTDFEISQQEAKAFAEAGKWFQELVNWARDLERADIERVRTKVSEEIRQAIADLEAPRDSDRQMGTTGERGERLESKRVTDEELRRQGFERTGENGFPMRGQWYLGREGGIFQSERDRASGSGADVFEFLRPIETAEEEGNH